jgi:hypothetical protein
MDLKRFDCAARSETHPAAVLPNIHTSITPLTPDFCILAPVQSAGPDLTCQVSEGRHEFKEPPGSICPWRAAGFFRFESLT